MKSPQEILEERLERQRSGPDCSDRLNSTISISRVESLSQVEKAHSQNRNVDGGIEAIYSDWIESSRKISKRLKIKGAADQYADVAGMDLLIKEDVKPAIAFNTGILSLDLALGGGIPNGVVEIYGKESVGKTTLVVDLVHSAQGQGMECALCCGEIFDKQRYKMLGVDLGSLVLIRGDGEDALNLCASFVVEGDRRALFIDSATALRPSEDQYDNWRLMLLSWLEWVSPKISPLSCVVMVNQARARKSISPYKTFAGGVDSAAKKILGYFNTRMEIQKTNVSDYHYDMVINIVANVLSAPAKLVVLPAHKTCGIDVWKDVVRMAVSMGVVELKGSWYLFFGSGHDRIIRQGEEAVARFLESNPNVGNTIFEKTLRACSS